MKISLAFLVVCAAALCGVTNVQGARLMCNSGSSSAASQYYCLAVDNSSQNACQQCAAGVKYWCPTSPTLSTASWKKGVNVLNNCASIARYTAIATFQNGVNYGGHAGVFYSCNAATQRIVVYDQYVGKPWGQRELWNLNGGISNDPRQFFTVEI